MLNGHPSLGEEQEAAHLHLLTSEDVDRDEVALGVTVLASLRRRDVGNLAGPAFDHDVPALADLASLHRVGVRRPRIGGLESLGDIIVRHAIKLRRAERSVRGRDDGGVSHFICTADAEEELQRTRGGESQG